MAREPRKTKPEPKDFSPYLEKEPTDLQGRFTEWIRDVVGYDPAAAKTKAEAFAEGVRLATALRMEFQASPENQELIAERRAARAVGVEKAAARKGVRKTRKPKAEEPEEDLEEDEPEEPEDEPEEDLEEDEDAEEPEPPKAARRTRATSRKASSAAAPATRTRRTRAKKGEAAPF